MDCSLPGSTVHGILKARILEWVAISISRGSSCLRDWTCVSCIADSFFTVWATRRAQYISIIIILDGFGGLGESICVNILVPSLFCTSGFENISHLKKKKKAVIITKPNTLIVQIRKRNPQIGRSSWLMFLVCGVPPIPWLPWWLNSKEPACHAGDTGSIPESGRCPGVENGSPLQYSCLEKSHGQRTLVGYSSWGHKTVRYNLATKHAHPIPYHLFAKQHHRHSDSSQLGKSAPKLTVLTLKRTFVFACVLPWFRKWHSVSLEM